MTREPVRDFGATPDEIRRGFDRIMSGTNLPDALQNQIYDKFYEAQERGSSKLLIEAARLIQQDFSWPFYDKWKTFFERHNTWPDSWDGRPFGWEEEDDVEEVTAEDELRFKALLLLRSINTAVYEELRVHQRNELMESGDRQYGLVCSGSSNCPIEANVAAMFNLGKSEGMPPFFPGDGSHIAVSSLHMIKKKGFTAESYKRCQLD